jgi:hypothetical protein
MTARNVPLGHFQGTVDATTAKSLATLIGTAIPGGSDWCQLYNDVAIRTRDDGTAPTASVGIARQANAVVSYDGDLAKLQAISESGAAIIDVAFYAGSPNQ